MSKFILYPETGEKESDREILRTMAENLDDFFAKRDKKKGKSKKFLSSEELVKQLEQAAKEKELSKKPAKIDEENEDGTIHEVISKTILNKLSIRYIQCNTMLISVSE